MRFEPERAAETGQPSDGQAGGSGGCSGNASQSERTGAKMSMTERTFRPDGDLMVDAGRDAPRPAGPELADLVADREVSAPGDAQAELLVLVLVPGHDRVRRELDERERDPFPFDPTTAHGLAPQIDHGQRREIDEVAHEVLRVGRAEVVGVARSAGVVADLRKDAPSSRFLPASLLAVPARRRRPRLGVPSRAMSLLDDYLARTPRSRGALRAGDRVAARAARPGRPSTRAPYPPYIESRRGLRGSATSTATSTATSSATTPR